MHQKCASEYRISLLCFHILLVSFCCFIRIAGKQSLILAYSAQNRRMKKKKLCINQTKIFIYTEFPWLIALCFAAQSLTALSYFNQLKFHAIYNCIKINGNCRHFNFHWFQHIKKLSSFSIRRRSSRNATIQPHRPPTSKGKG